MLIVLQTEDTFKNDCETTRWNSSGLLDVTKYRTDVYYNSKTGVRVHTAFPDGVVDDVNYDGSIKSFLFLLNNECCTSIDKSRRFLSDLTGGQLNISKGMIKSRNSNADTKKYSTKQKMNTNIHPAQ